MAENPIIKIPSIWSCKISSGWLNLAQCRKIEPCSAPEEPLCALITWNKGEEELFTGENAIAIIQSWREAHRKYGLNNIIEEKNQWRSQNQ